jgi:hypothetical protein
MIRDMSTIPIELRIALADLSMAEEMILSSVMPFMTLYRLHNGENVIRGFVANFPQKNQQHMSPAPMTT